MDLDAIMKTLELANAHVDTAQQALDDRGLLWLAKRARASYAELSAIIEEIKAQIAKQ